MNPSWNDAYHVIVAKFDSHCKHSGKLIVKGEKCLFKPNGSDIISCQSSRFFVMAKEEGWHQSYLDEIERYNKKVYDNMRRDWRLLHHDQVVCEGTEFECLAYYQKVEVHSWTNYHKQLGYKLERIPE